MLEQVIQWTQTNPSRNNELAPIEIRLKSDTDENATVINGAGGTVATPLDPPGPVSFYLWHTDPMYRGGTNLLRRQILREALVDYNLKISEGCKGHRWSRKKILEQLSAQQSANVSPPQDTPELDDALCYVLNFQKFILDDVHKKVYQFPKDLRQWSSEVPCWTTALGTRCLLHLPGERHLTKGVSSWLLLLEAEGWRIEWPVADMKVEDMKAACEALGVKPKAEKPKKDDWSATLGRAQALRHLQKEFS
jgi:hypothetical protein